MDDAELHLRIRVILVSTRAAVHSLGARDPQVPDVVERGRWLLDALASDVPHVHTNGVRQAFERARAELAALGADESPNAGSVDAPVTQGTEDGRTPS